MKLTPEMRAFLEEERFGVLATINRDGSPQQTVMWYALRDDQIMINTAQGRVKQHNLERDPRYSLAVEEGYKYLTVEGEVVEMIDDQEIAQPDIFSLAKRYNPGLSDAEIDEGWSYFKNEHRVTILFSIDKVIANGFGD